ncbi:hypothetical protein QBE52_07860 [Clostridiaceae bacterium 35-E11]
MDKIRKIYEGILEFIQAFMVKYKYENRGILKKMKIDSRLNMEIKDDKWCELFLYKSCFNHCAKFILLRYIEDSGYIYGKMNHSGIEKWKNFVKNISENFHILYKIAIKDLQEEINDSISVIFKESDYDVFEIDEELAFIMVYNFSSIDFARLDKKDIILLFRLIYSLEQREEMALEVFYKDAPALSHIFKLEKLENIG